VENSVSDTVVAEPPISLFGSEADWGSVDVVAMGGRAVLEAVSSIPSDGDVDGYRFEFIDTVSVFVSPDGRSKMLLVRIGPSCVARGGFGEKESFENITGVLLEGPDGAKLGTEVGIAW
jgi:hypothetical protein